MAALSSKILLVLSVQTLALSNIYLLMVGLSAIATIPSSAFTTKNIEIENLNITWLTSLLVIKQQTKLHENFQSELLIRKHNFR